jgi:hypothetical protein
VYPDLTPSQTPREALEAHAQNAFRYLLEEFGARFKAKRRASFTILTYVLREVFFEVEMDLREQGVFLVTGVPNNRPVPDFFTLDTQGNKVRWHFSFLLVESGRPDWVNLSRRIKTLHRGTGPEAMTNQIDASAAAIREVLPDLPAMLAHLRESPRRSPS